MTCEPPLYGGERDPVVFFQHSSIFLTQLVPDVLMTTPPPAAAAAAASREPTGSVVVRHGCVRLVIDVSGSEFSQSRAFLSLPCGQNTGAMPRTDITRSGACAGYPAPIEINT